MQTDTLLYIIVSGIIALLVALFQYKYKSKYKGQLSIVFTVLRFLSVFALLLLLVNPKFDQIKVFTEKPNLVIALDNSNSIVHLKQDQNARNVLKAITSNTEIQRGFEVNIFHFDETIEGTDTIGFNGTNTDIDKSLRQFSNIYKNAVAPIILISDGNQTFGNDYAVSNTYKQPVYPVILGDTITYTDLKIQQINVNKYAFLKNKFPVEAILVYQGNEAVTSNFAIRQNGKVLFSKTINFSKHDNSKIINLTLPANSAGIRSYKAILSTLKNEKNTINNTKNFAVEVIDQKTKIALVSDFPHPDLGALKKSIETNEQRSVTILNSSQIASKINDFQLFILYQPNSKFKQLYEVLDKNNKNSFTVVGAKTDLRFVNNVSNGFKHDVTNQSEDYQPELNLNYAPFLVEDINFDSFPPLRGPFGGVTFNVPFETLLERTVLGIVKNEPLLATYESNNKRAAVLFGENIWQWRAQSYLNEESFGVFDDFIGKLIQYLASNKRKSRLSLEFESFYTGSTNILIKAQAFDKNYQFDARQSLEIVLENTISKKKQTLPLVLKGNNYQVDLSGLEASIYNFTVRSKGEDIARSGRFEVLEYNIEQQFLNADVTKLQQLATNTKGKSYFMDGIENLISDILGDERYKPIQKSSKNTVPLIDWKYLLALIVLTLSAEWFLRKYNGLI
ncbi:hypothetical protein MHTCC0001_04560 [Flavobacteriaceae bacterium MHTCC 0001]